MEICAEHSVELYKITNKKRWVDQRKTKQVIVCCFEFGGFGREIIMDTYEQEKSHYKPKGGETIFFPAFLRVLPMHYFDSIEEYDSCLALSMERHKSYMANTAEYVEKERQKRLKKIRKEINASNDIYEKNKDESIIDPFDYLFMDPTEGGRNFNETRTRAFSRLTHITVVHPNHELVTSSPSTAIRQSNTTSGVDQQGVILPNQMLKLAIDKLPHLTIGELVDLYIWMGGGSLVEAIAFFRRHYRWIYLMKQGEKYYLKITFNNNPTYPRCSQFIMSGDKYNYENKSNQPMKQHEQLVHYKPNTSANRSKPHLEYDLCVEMEVTNSDNPFKWKYTVLRVRDEATKEMKHLNLPIDSPKLKAGPDGIYFVDAKPDSDVIDLC